jgi:hypothetical protein
MRELDEWERDLAADDEPFRWATELMELPVRAEWLLPRFKRDRERLRQLIAAAKRWA